MTDPPPRSRKRRRQQPSRAMPPSLARRAASTALLLLACAASNATLHNTTTAQQYQDAPIFLHNNPAFDFPQLPEALPHLEPAAAAKTPGWWFHALRAVTLDPRTGRVHWLTEPCGRDNSNKACLGSLTSIQLLRQQTLSSTSPACRAGGVGFSLDPDDPHDPLGKHFRKRFYPEECADLWSDLLPGAVLFQADWDLKRLLHNVDGVGAGLGAWYRPIEAWYRDDKAPASLGEEVLAKVWLVAEAVEAAEAPLGLALGQVTLRLKAVAVRRDPASPTGLVEEGDGRPPHPAVERFVAVCNAHMGELAGHFPSFGLLQQLVLAQEAARFLRDRGVALAVDPGLAALRSPLTGLTRVPALQLERTRRVTVAGIVSVGGAAGKEEEVEAAAAAVWLKGLGPVAQRAGSREVVGLDGANNVQAFTCGVRNATLQGLASLDALFRSGAALDCKPERVVFDPFSGARPPTQTQDGEEWATEEEENDDADDTEVDVSDACEEALAVWSEQLEAWRVWPSRPLPPPPPSPTNELVPAPVAGYNATGRVVLLEEVDGEEGSVPVVLLAWKGPGQAARVEAAVRRLNATAVLVVQEEGEEEGSRGRRRRQRRRRTGEPGDEEDAVLRGIASRVPLRLLAPEVGEELRAMARLSALDDEEDEGGSGSGSGLRVWLACGVERALGGDGGDDDDDDANAEGARTVVHEGVEYRTLDLALVDRERSGCQAGPRVLPEGFEIAPAYPDVVAGVVKLHPWATAALLLRATDPTCADAALSFPPGFVAHATATQGPRRAGQRLDFSAGLMVVNSSDPEVSPTYRPFRCDARVLLRRTVTTVTYAGYVYRALEEGVAVDGTEVAPGPPPDFEGLDAAAARLPPGEGWEISPADRGIAQKVAAAHPWATDVLILADGKGYPTQLYYHRKAQRQQEGAGPLVPHHRVLIRRPLVSEPLGGAGPEGQGYRVGDAYRADASARLQLRRLGKVEGERGLRYLLEMEVAERVMIHGGVDLTAVRRVPLSTAGGGGGVVDASADAQLLVALERAAAEGRLGKGGVWQVGDQTYSVLSVAGLDDGQEDE